MKRYDSTARLWQIAETVRQTAPLIQNLTNLVMQNDTASAITAVGGTQMTLHGVEEASEVAAMADALAVNPGTPDDLWMTAAHRAITVAQQRGTPWVLDPVAVGFSAYRTRAIQALLAQNPSVIKANASEMLALSGAAASGRAADSVHAVDQAAAAAHALAGAYRCVVAVTGDRDLITDGQRTVRVRNGLPLMGRMVGSGCMLTSVIACFLAAADDCLEATLAALGCFAVAGEIAAMHAAGPGTLKPALIDALYGLDQAQIEQRLALEWQSGMP